MLIFRKGVTMLNPKQLRELIVRPVLQVIELWSPAAENLVCGTALNETNLEYIAQIPNPIALSLWQIENATYQDLVVRLQSHKGLHYQVTMALNMMAIPTHYDFLAGNLYAGAIFCRLKYYFDAHPLPDADNIAELANMWGKIYNTKDIMADKARFVARYLAAYPK